MTLTALLLPLALIAQGPTAPPTQDKVLKKDDVVGTGPAVQAGDILTIDYIGKLKDGTTFDTSTSTFMYGVGQVIKGMDLGIAGMKEGGKRELTIPPSLGYGDQSIPKIPSNSTLRFTITLKKIEPKVQTAVITKGAGDGAKFGDTVFIFIVGGVKGGNQVFDSKAQSKDPVAVGVGESHLPIGLSAGMIGMEEGETRHILIPPSLAYKDKGIPPTDQDGHKAGSIVPPNSWMEFTIQLVKIEHHDPKQTAGQ